MKKSVNKTKSMIVLAAFLALGTFIQAQAQEGQTPDPENTCITVRNVTKVEKKNTAQPQYFTVEYCLDQWVNDCDCVEVAPRAGGHGFHTLPANLPSITIELLDNEPTRKIDVEQILPAKPNEKIQLSIEV